MRVEILNTGSELTLGFVTNTHLSYLARKLGDLGLEVARQTTVGDSAAELRAAFRDAAERADLLIVTGGLGPTSDDITRDIAAEIFGRQLLLNPSVLKLIHARFARSSHPIPKQVEVQAMVPEGATVLANSNGTAPGLALEVPRETFNVQHSTSNVQPAPRAALLVVLLPGPPRELQPMFEQHALPLIATFTGVTAPLVIRILKIACLGESFIAERIGDQLADLPGVDLGYCARPSEVDVRIVVRPVGNRVEAAVPGRSDETGALGLPPVSGATSPKAAETAAPTLAAIADDAVWRIRGALGTAIFGEGEERLEQVIVRLLAERRQTLAVAESCTGGFISSRITNVSGSSAIFLNGLVTYANTAKTRLLGVSNETLERFGAVSEPTARQMAEAVRLTSKADYGIGVTGIAGPAGGSAEKPVGTTFIALASAAGTEVTQHSFRFDRETFKFVVSQYALEKVRRRILNLPDLAPLRYR